MSFLSRLMPDRTAEQVVPRSGYTSWLTIFSALAMAALAVAAVSATLAANRLADRWTSELARSATIVISATGAAREDEIARALATLETTAGIETAYLMERSAQEALLAPWLGEDLPFDILPVPALILVSETSTGPDLEALELRLSAEAPSARYDNHTRWRRPMVEIAQRLTFIALSALLLISAATATMISLAARAAIAANRSVLETVMLMGADGEFILAAYLRRFTLRAFYGGTVGALLSAMAFFALPNPTTTEPFSTGLAPQGLEWLWVLTVPFGIALVAYGSTLLALRRVLTELEDI